MALVNGEPITKEQFIQRLEFTPFPEFHKVTERNKRALDALIDEMVVSQWAVENRLDDSPEYIEAVDFARQQALIRELYLEEIRAHAEPDSEPIHQALQKSTQQLKVRALFSKDEDIAGEWRKSLRSGKTFEDLAIEAENDHRTQITHSSIHWGDGTVPIQVERTAYQLNPGEASEVVELSHGYAILFVEHRVQDLFLTPYELHNKRQQVKQLLQARVESRLANEYVNNLLAPLTIRQKAVGFLEVIKSLRAELDFRSEDSLQPPMILRDEIKLSEAFDLSLPVIQAPDFVWDGKDVLLLLRKYDYPINTENGEALSKSLTGFLKSTVRDHYLAERAKELGLESTLRVRADTQMWRRYFLYMMGISALHQNKTVESDKEQIAERIRELRDKAQVKINASHLQSIELTGIPMLVFWGSDLNRQLVVPPLVQF
ncbi:MAG: peptidylprolyl isomerase [Candidatus Neomarinimicrobiota bacterium]